MIKEKTNWKIMLVDLENKLADFFLKKFPALPDNVKEFIVKYIPHFTILSVVLAILGILVGTVVAPLAFLSGIRAGFGQIILVVFTIIAIVLNIKAIKGLFAKEMKAWKLIFYVSLISAASSLLRLDVLGLIIGSGISWYVLFQIRKYYK